MLRRRRRRPDVPDLPERGGRRQGAYRCVSAWRSTGATRCARAATPRWIRSASRSRTSTPSAAGAPRARRNTPIDASAALPDGTKFDGPAELRQLLASRRDEFVRTVIEKMLVYALGRGLEYYDMPTVRRIQRDAAAADYRWSSLIQAIVQSTPFQMRRSEP